MKAQKFINSFANITSNPTSLDGLRKFILILAVRGKLVEQDPNHEPAKELLTRYIRSNERNKLPVVDNASFHIPTNWSAEYLGNIATQITKGSTPTTYGFQFQPQGIRFIKVENIDKGNIVHESIKDFISEDANNAQARSQLYAGDILFSIAGTIGETCVVRSDDLPANVNQALAIIRGTNPIFDPEFLKLQLDSFITTIKESARGGAMNNVSLSDLRELLVFVPPLMEQRRIVSKAKELKTLCDELEKHQKKDIELRQQANFSLVAELIKTDTRKDLVAIWNKYAANLADLLNTESNVDTLVEALKTSAVLGKLDIDSIEGNSQEIINESLAKKKKLLASKAITKQTLLPKLSQDEINQGYPSRWSVVRFDDLANVSGGITKGRKFKGRTTSNHPYLRVANVQRGYFLLNDIQEIEILDDEFERYVLKDGDILITEGGDWDKVGRTAIWRNQLPGCLHQNHVFKARLFSEQIKKEWIELVFNSSVGREYWQSASKQTTNLASINMTQVRSFSVPIPSTEEQELILDQLGKLLSICDELKQYMKKLAEVQEKFAKAAIYDILYNGSGRNKMATEETTTAKSYKRQISVTLALVPEVKGDLTQTRLAAILAQSGGNLEAKELWKASEIKEIDDFYACLKQEIDAGFIQQPAVAEVKLTEEAE